MRAEPAAASWLLELFSSSEEHESITGDLLEQYHFGRGRLWYWRQVLVIVLLRLYRASARRPANQKHRLSVRRRLVPLLLFTAFMAFGVFDVRMPDEVAVSLILGVPWVIFGRGMVSYWHKRRPCLIQALSLRSQNANSIPQSIRPLKTVLGLLPASHSRRLPLE